MLRQHISSGATLRQVLGSADPDTLGCSELLECAGAA